MNDDLTNLERVMREKAAEVPYLQEAPRKMLARARRRVVRNTVASVLAIGLILAGASAGLGALRAPDATGPAVNPSTGHSPTPAPSTDACIAANLRATTALQGAAGSVVGAIHVTNVGSGTCTLTGRPVVRIVSSTGAQVSVTVRDVGPQWQADKSPRPQGWPVVSLRPGSVAALRVAWSNPCPQLSGVPRWRIDLGGGTGSLDVSDPEATPPPPCNGPGEPSRLQVGPFEPGTE